jgi:hypothetical protein
MMSFGNPVVSALWHEKFSLRAKLTQRPSRNASETRDYLTQRPNRNVSRSGAGGSVTPSVRNHLYPFAIIFTRLHPLLTGSLPLEIGVRFPSIHQLPITSHLSALRLCDLA